MESQAKAIAKSIGETIGWYSIYRKALQTGAFDNINEVYEKDFEEVIKIISLSI